MNNRPTLSVPDTAQERLMLRKAINEYGQKLNLIPPLSMEELTRLSIRFVDQNDLDRGLVGWVTVELNNSIWRDIVASIPLSRRVLMLPKCLNNSVKCGAEIDDFGLLCKRCNSCNIPDLQDHADKLGMISIVAEGFTSVVEMVKNGVVDVVIGVGCLDSLEKAFPLLTGNAVAGVAVALNSSGCKDTSVDVDYVLDMMELSAAYSYKQLDYDLIKSSIDSWFNKADLAKIFSTGPTSDIALNWLCGSGKRWRPYLLTAVYMAITGNDTIDEKVKNAALAVECFHKASLVHDDIQDDDKVRYGKQTVHAEFGIPIAINVGDTLVGEGYKLMARCDSIEIIEASGDAHTMLCKGQGMELDWMVDPKAVDIDFVMAIIKNKTVPAFEIALRIGAICANADKGVIKTLTDFSTLLGIAYQLKDDIEDFEAELGTSLRPSSVLARICRDNCDFVADILQFGSDAVIAKSENKILIDKALSETDILKEDYRVKALESISSIKNIELKRLLFRVAEQVLK